MEKGKAKRWIKEKCMSEYIYKTVHKFFTCIAQKIAKEDPPPRTKQKTKGLLQFQSLGNHLKIHDQNLWSTFVGDIPKEVETHQAVFLFYARQGEYGSLQPTDVHIMCVVSPHIHLASFT